MILQVSIWYAVGAIAMLYWHRHEVGPLYPGAFFFWKRFVSTTNVYQEVLAVMTSDATWRVGFGAWSVVGRVWCRV